MRFNINAKDSGTSVLRGEKALVTRFSPQEVKANMMKGKSLFWRH
jgi:hypothetical protein